MSTPPTTTQLRRYLDGLPSPEVEQWLASDPLAAAAALDALPIENAYSPIPVASPPAVAELMERLRPAGECEQNRDQPPAAIGNYRVVRELGRGGMGVVYLAEDPLLLRPVCVKVVKPELAADPVFRQQFLKECQFVAGSPSNHVVIVYGAEESEAGLFLVMEHLHGMNLEDWLCSHLGRCGEADVWRVAEQVLAGLSHIHQSGFVHRDVKPANLWLERTERRVKILDFGVAASAAGYLRAGTGTRGYMAPEPDQDRRADFYSLGAVLYRMVTGQPPTVPLAEVPDHLGGLTPACRRFILRLLSPNPADRPNDAAGALAELHVAKQAELYATKQEADRAAAELHATKQQGERAAADARTNASKWGWIVVALSACLGVVAVGWALDKVAAARQASARAELLEEIRKTDVELSHGAQQLDQARDALDRARQVKWDGKDGPDPAEIEKFTHELMLYNNIQAKVIQSAARRRELLKQLEAVGER